MPSPSKKAKPTLWQSLTHSPSQSYLSSAPRRVSASPSTSFSTHRPPSISSFHSDSNQHGTATRHVVVGSSTGWVHPSLRKSMADVRGGAEREVEDPPRRKKSSTSSRRRREAEEQQERERLAAEEEERFNLAELESQRVTSRRGGSRGEGSSTGATERERRTFNSSSSRPEPSSSRPPTSSPSRTLSSPPLEPTCQPSSNHSRSNSFSSSNSGSRTSRFGSPSLGTVVEDTSPAEQPQEQPRAVYFNSSGRGGWNTPPSAPAPPPLPTAALLPRQQQQSNPRRPPLPASNTASNTNYSPSVSSSFNSPEQHAVASPVVPFLAAAVTLENLTPPDSEVGLGIRARDGPNLYDFDAGEVAQALLDRSGTRRRKSLVWEDGSSEEDDVFYTPRSSIYSIKDFVAAEPESPPTSSTPTLTLQPPTPLAFPGGIREERDQEQDGRGRDLFAEISFHQERRSSEGRQEKDASSSSGLPPPPRAPSPSSQRSPTPLTRRAGGSPSFMPSPLSNTHLDDAYSGLAYDDEPLTPLPPPRFPSSTSSSSPSSTESSSSSRPVEPLTPTPPTNTHSAYTYKTSVPTSSQQPFFVPPHLRPFPKRPGSVISNISTSSEYSQASYRSEVDAPPPIIIPNPASRPRSLFSPSTAASPSQRNSTISISTSPQSYSTPFLPRPTSSLIDSFAESTRYPSLASAPASVTGGSDGARRRSVLSFSGAGGGGGGSETGRRASEGEESRRRRVVSEAGKNEKRAMSTVSTYRMPQVMGSPGEEGAAESSLSGGRGYSTLVLPSGAYRPTKPSITSTTSLFTSSRPLSVVGLPSSTISTLSLLSAPRHSNPASLPNLSVSYTSHTPPPTKLSSSHVLVRVWAIAFDGHDAHAARKGQQGMIVGRSWVGKVVECGQGSQGGGKGFAKGEWVYGLVPSGGGGAAREFLTVERRWLAGCAEFGRESESGEGRMTLEDVASLPLLGVTAHRAVGGVTRGSRALVLLGGGSDGSSDWGIGILAAQELLAKGAIVVIQVVEEWGGEEWARSAVGAGTKLKEGNVKVGEAVEIVHGEHEGSFDFVLDCLGGRRVYDASRRIMVNGGTFTSTKGDLDPLSPTTSPTTKNSFRSLRRTFIRKDKKAISYLVLPPSGSGPVVDSLGEDVRDVLEWISTTRPYRPVRVEKVVPLERGGEAFELQRSEGPGRGNRYACEEEVWGVRVVS